MIRERCEEDHHKYGTGGPKERVGEEARVQNTGYETGDQYHEEHRKGAVGFLEHRAKEEYIRKVAHQMVPVRMARDMGEQTKIVKRFKEIKGDCVRYREQTPGEANEHELVQKNDESAKKSKGKGRWGVILDFHSTSLPGSGLSP